MVAATPPDFSSSNSSTDAGDRASNTVARINSRDLFRCAREVEIDHDGRIYRLRLTQLNKLILNA
jgi:hemin uptake protein HemP